MLLLAVSVGGLSVLLYSQTAALREQRRQVRELTARLESKTASLDLQAKCAKQAHEAFKINGYGFEKNEMAVLSNHYNEKLSKCFVLIEDTDAKTVPGIIYENKTVSDAFEGKVYAQYGWHTDKVKKYWEVPPYRCKVMLPSGEEKICHSSDEFDALVKEYME